jgi:hypothetical protein
MPDADNTDYYSRLCRRRTNMDGLRFILRHGRRGYPSPDRALENPVERSRCAAARGGSREGRRVGVPSPGEVRLRGMGGLGTVGGVTDRHPRPRSTPMEGLRELALEPSG